MHFHGPDSPLVHNATILNECWGTGADNQEDDILLFSHVNFNWNQKHLEIRMIEDAEILSMNIYLSFYMEIILTPTRNIFKIRGQLVAKYGISFNF